MKLIDWIIQDYSKDDYLTYQKSKSLAIISFVGILLAVSYSAIFIINGLAFKQVFNFIIIPLLFIFILIITLFLIKKRQLNFAGNLFITVIIIAQTVTIYSVIKDMRIGASLMSSYFYLFSLIAMSALYSTQAFITFNFIYLAVINFLFYLLVVKSGLASADIKIAVTDFYVNLIGLYIFISYFKRILRIAIERLNYQKQESERKNQQLISILDKMQKTILQLQQTNDKLIQISEQISARSVKQATITEEVAASTEEINATVQTTSDLAQKTHKISSKSADDVREGEDVLNSTIETFLKISEKIEIISNIADKTDILAINAAIEAAHAGDYGHGFAIVAQEIRKLSDLAKEASKQISDLSAAAQSQAQNTKLKFHKIVNNILEIAQHMEDIANATEEQLQSINQITQSTSQLSAFAEENSTIANELVTYAHKLAELSKTLKQVSNS